MIYIVTLIRGLTYTIQDIVFEKDMSRSVDESLARYLKKKTCFLVEVLDSSIELREDELRLSTPVNHGLEQDDINSTKEE